jgi:pimeloyl-ACP methyl ester carboxylesterase
VNTAISSDGVGISFSQQGKGDPALVFIHGWSNNKSIWDTQVSYFSEKYNVVTIDLAGYGASGNNRNNWTMSAFGDDVVAVINKLKLKQVVLVGFSMGGPVVVETAKKIPELVSGIVLVDILQNIEMEYSTEMIENMKNYFMDIVSNPSQEKLEGTFFKRNIKESFQRTLGMLESASQVGWEEMVVEKFRWENDDCIESLKMIKAPIVAINSDTQPTNVEAFRKYIPSFNVRIMKDVGHVVMWDAPEEFNRLLEESIQEL